MSGAPFCPRPVDTRVKYRINLAFHMVKQPLNNKLCMCTKQARSRGGGGGGGGGVGGVPTPPSGIDDIHNTNYLIQERPFDCF